MSSGHVEEFPVFLDGLKVKKTEQKSTRTDCQKNRAARFPKTAIVLPYVIRCGACTINLKL